MGRRKPPAESEEREISRDIGRRLKAKRESLGIGTVELARLAGVTRSHIWNIETGIHAPRLDTLLKVCLALGMKRIDL